MLGLYASGDCSIATAVRNGGLRKVDHVDYEQYSILGFVTTFKVTAYGE